MNLLTSSSEANSHFFRGTLRYGIDDRYRYGRLYDRIWPWRFYNGNWHGRLYERHEWNWHGWLYDRIWPRRFHDWDRPTRSSSRSPWP